MLSIQERIAKGEEAIAQKRVAGEPVPHEWEVHLARLKALAGGPETGATPAVPPEPQCSVEPCSVCGGSAYWRSRCGVVVCRVCHPPADPAAVTEWMPSPQQQPATPSAGGHGGGPPMKGLLYLRDGGDFGEACWQAEKDGQPIRYKRVLASVSAPTPNEPRGCVLVLAEHYDPKAPVRFTALAGRITPWADLEGKLVALRRALKPATLVVEPGEEPLAAVRRLLPDLRRAAPHVPCAVIPAPADALGEITRWALNGLIHENRLTVDAVRSVVDQAPEAGARALQSAVAWCLRHPMRYGPRSEVRAASKKRARSYSGRPPGPDEPTPAPLLPSPRPGGQVLVPTTEGRQYHFGLVGGRPLHPDLRERNKRRARSAVAGFKMPYRVREG